MIKTKSVHSPIDHKNDGLRILIVKSLKKLAASICATRTSRIMGRNSPYDYFRDWEEKAAR